MKTQTTTISIGDVERAFEALKAIFESESGKKMDNERFLVDDIATDLLSILKSNTAHS